jgi:hypothetical protein
MITATKQQYFTKEQATKSLILVEPIVKDIMVNRQKMIEIKKEINNILEKDYNADVSFLKNTLKETSKKITYCLEELEMIGCYLKDFQLGIINFPSIIWGRVVFLSWAYGETKVQYWHELTKGFENRIKI